MKPKAIRVFAATFDNQIEMLGPKLSKEKPIDSIKIAVAKVNKPGIGSWFF
ncbi:MAG: hypothetical protein ACPG5L_04430 [Vibrio gallaecicus]